MAEQEVPSSTSNYSYHIFFSFGQDTSKTFAGHLYTALDNAGFRTFRHERDIEAGQNVELQLQKAIERSRVSMVVFSKEYASSSQCLDELVLILKQSRTSKHLILPVFYDVDPAEVRTLSGSFKEALTRHEDRFKAQASEWTAKIKGWKESLAEIANLAGMSLRNQTGGHESKFIKKIIKVISGRLGRPSMNIESHLVGVNSQVERINMWLQDESVNAALVAICGIGGIGKTTLVKIVYDMNRSRFEGSSFLPNIREVSEEHNGVVHLQQQLISDVLKGRKEKINNVDEGIIKIKGAISCKKVLIVLDNVDKRKQLEEVLGMQDWLFPGSKIIITTRHRGLLRVPSACKVHMVEKLKYDESIELFSWYAFGQNDIPNDDYRSISSKVVNYCQGHPLAIKVLGSSLCGLQLNLWKSQLEKLQNIPNSEVLKKLKISYDNLQDDEDKNLFLHIACFFVGDDKDYMIEILNGCDFHTEIGIQNLIDRCLLIVDPNNKLVMHQLVQDMGREIVRQESPTKPEKRSRVWNHKDSFNILREKIGTPKIEGLTLDMHLVNEEKSTKMAFGSGRKRHFEEFQDQSLVSTNITSSLKRFCFSLTSWNSISNASGNSNEDSLETSAFDGLHNLKLLQLKYVKLQGSYSSFPKGLRWLCWHGFPSPTLPNNFHLQRLIVLELPYNCLKTLSSGAMYFASLKILNLSHSKSCSITFNISTLPNLEKLILSNCKRLVEIPESVGQLKKLVLLDLSDCISLRKLPNSIAMLKYLETLDISGCSNLEDFTAGVKAMESLRMFCANSIIVKWILSTYREFKAWYPFINPLQLLKVRKNPEMSWGCLWSSLVTLKLRNCNLMDENFPKNLSSLPMLREIDLSENPIYSLPACIKSLAGLEALNLRRCQMLQSVIGIQNLRELNFIGCRSLDKVNLQLSRRQGYSYHYGRNDNLVEFSIMRNQTMSWGTKIEPLENVDDETINSLGLSNLESMAKPIVPLYSGVWGTTKKLPPQVIYRHNWFSTFLRGNKIPASFNFRNMGSSITIVVPSCLDWKIRGLTLGAVYSLSNSDISRNRPCYCKFIFTVSNKTENQSMFAYTHTHAIPAAKEEMTWLVYPKFRGQFKVGDELNISMHISRIRRRGLYNYEVKEVGARILYELEMNSTGLVIKEKERDRKHVKAELQLPQTSWPFKCARTLHL